MQEVYNERIDRIISSLGIMSRSACRRAARDGRIYLNGEAVRNTDRKVTERDELLLDGSKIVYSKYMYLLLNKPEGYVCAAEDGRYPTVFELLPSEYSNLKLSTVGRLDMNTTGVLLITNDGTLSHALLSPKRKVEKVYRAALKFPVSERDAESFAEGLTLDGNEKALPARLLITGEREAEVTVCEGKFHQIKRMFLAVHNQVRRLERISFAGITSDGVKIGEWRVLTPDETETLRRKADI